MANFVKALKNNLDNTSYTENGAKGYKTTGEDLVDFFYKISSFRNESDEKIINEFDKLLESNYEYILKFLFYIRDCREGLGERRLFRLCMKELLASDKFQANHKDVIFFTHILELIIKYGRADDLYYIFDFDDMQYRQWFKDYLRTKLDKDLVAMKEQKPISLLAKWLPSENASSKSTKELAKLTRQLLEMSPRQYRKVLSKLRSYLKVTETFMCSNHWNDIDYNIVPSKANLIYSDAFMKHDEERRQHYLEALSSGKEGVKINSSVNYPHEIYAKYKRNRGDYDETLEQLWKNLKQAPGLDNTLVVCDGSGSMTFNIINSVCALDVSRSLAIYCSEHCKSEYKDTFITFSDNPEIVDLSKGENLLDKINIIRHYNDYTNTDIEAVFDLIFEVAIKNKLDQEDLPKQLLIISDMEFDQGVDYTGNPIESAQHKFATQGYTLPKLVFWNVNSRTETIPVKENELGILLISGFSQNVLNLVTNGEFDTFKALMKELEKYGDVPALARLPTVK